MSLRRFVMLCAAALAIASVLSLIYRVLTSVPMSDMPAIITHETPQAEQKTAPDIIEQDKTEPDRAPLPSTTPASQTPNAPSSTTTAPLLTESTTTPSSAILSFPPLRRPQNLPADVVPDASVPVQDAPHEDETHAPSVLVPEFDIVRVEEGEALVAGRGSPSATIIIMDHGRDVARVEIDASASFAAQFPLPVGDHELTLCEELNDITVVSQQKVTLVTAPPAELARAEPQEDNQTRDKRVHIDQVDMNEQGALYVQGTAQSHDRITLSIDDKLHVDIEAGEDGSWQAHITAPQPAGAHDIVIKAHSDAATPQPSEDRVTFRAPLISLSADVTVRRGDNLWRISRTYLGRGIRYIEIYARNRPQIRDPNLIFPGQKLTLLQP